MQFLDKVVDAPEVFLGSLAVGAVQLLDKAADMPALSSLGFVQFLDTVIDLPVVVQVVGCRAENCGSSAVAVL